jgi:hypothetical protein
MDRRQRILDEVTDLVSNFLYYDRKEDEELPRGAIEQAIANREVTVDEIGYLFKAKIDEGLR